MIGHGLNAGKNISATNRGWPRTMNFDRRPHNLCCLCKFAGTTVLLVSIVASSNGARVIVESLNNQLPSDRLLSLSSWRAWPLRLEAGITLRAKTHGTPLHNNKVSRTCAKCREFISSARHSSKYAVFQPWECTCTEKLLPLAVINRWVNDPSSNRQCLIFSGISLNICLCCRQLMPTGWYWLGLKS